MLCCIPNTIHLWWADIKRTTVNLSGGTFAFSALRRLWKSEHLLLSWRFVFFVVCSLAIPVARFAGFVATQPQPDGSLGNPKCRKCCKVNPVHSVHSMQCAVAWSYTAYTACLSWMSSVKHSGARPLILAPCRDRIGKTDKYYHYRPGKLGRNGCTVSVWAPLVWHIARCQRIVPVSSCGTAFLFAGFISGEPRDFVL